MLSFERTLNHIIVDPLRANMNNAFYDSLSVIEVQLDIYMFNMSV